MPDPAWRSAADLVTDDALDHWWATVAAGEGTDHPEVVARVLLAAWVHLPAAAVVRSLVRQQRAPLLRADALRFRLAPDGWPVAFDLGDPAFACVADDPGAHAAALVVPDHAAVIAVARLALADHAAPMLAALRRRARIGDRTLWAEAAEACAVTAAWASRADGPAANDLVLALIGDPGCRLHADLEFVSLATTAGPLRWPLGAACCAAYRKPGGRFCATCPHRPRGQRLAALEHWAAALILPADWTASDAPVGPES